MKRTVFLKMIIICVIAFNACAKTEEPETIMWETKQSAATPSTTSENTAQEETTTDNQKQWRINICSDMPQPYIAVLAQYEQFLNADNQDLNDESVRAKFWDGEWADLHDEFCRSLVPLQSWGTEEDIADIFHYALTDLTGDGFPELILAYRDTPEVIYTYSEANGMKKECATCYYEMTIYENGIVEYVSGGVNYSTTYLRFQADIGEWVVADTIGASETWDAAQHKLNDTEYYGGSWNDAGWLTDKISEEEYRRIQEKYVTEPMRFEWIPLVAE